MDFKEPPNSWFWMHDVDPYHPRDSILRGYNITKLSSYGDKQLRRYVTISYSNELDNVSQSILDVPSSDFERLWNENLGFPVSISSYIVDKKVSFSLVYNLEKKTGRKVHLDLDIQSFNELLQEKNSVIDFTSYLVNGVYKFAAIMENRPSVSSSILHNVSAKELDIQLNELGAVLTHIRRYINSDGNVAFTAVAEKMRVSKWSWFTGLTSDEVATKLSENNSYPIDITAYRQAAPNSEVQYTVIMYGE